MTTTGITVPTSLLEAAARWAAPDGVELRHLQQVRLDDGELLASDGMRGVRIPMQTHGLTLGIWRAHALTAVAAQDALVKLEGRVAGRGLRSITVQPITGGRVRLHLADDGAVSIVVPECTATFPVEHLRGLWDTSSNAAVPTPDGFCFDPTLLAAVDDVRRAFHDGDTGVRVVKWGGPLDPMFFDGPALEGCGPSRMVVMPMRPPT